MSDAIPALFTDALKLAHASWRPVLRAGLAAVAEANPAYLPDLAADTFLPTEGRIFAAFSQPRLFEFRGANVRWIPEERPSWFSKPWEYGRFENEDGSAIEDARLQREIYDVWDAQNRSSNTD